jgi:hypothetical protein
MTRPADRRPMRRYLLALLALTLLSGCGGGVDSSLLASAVRNTEAEGGAEVAFQMRMEVPGLGEPVVFTGGGVEDANRRRARLTFDMSALGDIPGADGLCSDGCEMEAIQDDLAIYTRSDLFGSALGGKEWMKLDLRRGQSSMGLDFAGAEQFGQSASEQLRMLKAVSGEVTEEGTDQVAGVEATHYSATVDLRRYPDVMPEDQREAARRGIERLIELTGQSEVPVDIWIDGEERVRRLEMTQSVRQGAVEGEMDITVEYVRFGVPVDVDVPDDDDVFDATDLTIEEMENVQP